MPLTLPAQNNDSGVAACALISAAILGLAFPPWDWSLLAWIALAPLGVVLSSREMTNRSWAGVYLGGLFFHLLVLGWMRTLYGGVGLSGNFATGWLVSGQLGAILFCLMVVVGRRAVLVAGLPVSIALPLVWMSYEYLQCPIASLFDQAGVQLVSLAYTQANCATIAQIADLGGASLISLLVAATGGFAFDATKWILSTKTSDGWLGAARLLPVPIALAATLAYGQAQLERGPAGLGPTVCLMGEQDLPPLLDERRIIDAGESLHAGDDPPHPNLLVWSELAFHHVLVSPSECPKALAALSAACPLANGNVPAYTQTVRRHLENAAAELQAGVIIGGERIEVRSGQVRCYNCLTYVDPVFGIRGLYDKRHLAPFTEFMPSTGHWLQTASRKNYQHGQSAMPLEFRPLDSDREYQLGFGLCYDVAFAAHFRRQAKRGDVDFFVVSGSEISDRTGCLSELLLRMAQLRAIENRRPIVRNTKLGYSGLIDANGQVVRTNDRRELTTPWSLGAVPLDHRVSLYSYLGGWLSPTCFGLMLALLIKPTISSRRNRSRSQSDCTKPQSSPAEKMIRRAFSLMELMAVIAIIGTISAVLVPRVSVSSDAAKEASNSLNRTHINAAVERWYLEKGSWPRNNLSDIGADPNYFPDGIPLNPETGAVYRLNAITHRVIVSGGGGGK